MRLTVPVLKKSGLNEYRITSIRKFSQSMQYSFDIVIDLEKSCSVAQHYVFFYNFPLTRVIPSLNMGGHSFKIMQHCFGIECLNRSSSTQKKFECQKKSLNGCSTLYSERSVEGQHHLYISLRRVIHFWKIEGVVLPGKESFEYPFQTTIMAFLNERVGASMCKASFTRE